MSEVWVSNWKNIEAALRQHASVKDCVVLDRENVPGNRRVVAYIESNQAVVTTANELRSHIIATLPNYRVPDMFIFRTRFPKTPDGTVDRAALMTIDKPECDLPQGYLAPRTLNEKLMSNIWEETLQLKDIGVYDNFFDIVRDSSLAMEIIARVRKVFTVNLPVRALFADPTVAGMTAAVLQQQNKWTNRRGLAESVSELAMQRREQSRNHLSKH
jgi:hypothetical protein